MSEPPLDTGDIRVAKDERRAIGVWLDAIIAYELYRHDTGDEFIKVGAFLRDEEGCEQAARWVEGADDCPAIRPLGVPFIKDGEVRVIIADPRSIGKITLEYA